MRTDLNWLVTEARGETKLLTCKGGKIGYWCIEVVGEAKVPTGKGEEKDNIGGNWET